MCTSFTFTDLDDNVFLARTMDFGFELEANPLFCPRDYHWGTETDQTQYRGHLAVVGAGRELEKIVFVDGVNEHGLGGAALYLPGEVQYNPECVSGKVNLAPHEVLYWLLSTCDSLTAVATKVKELNIVDQPVSLLGITSPLHWIFSDRTGKTLVIEPTTLDLVAMDNPVGVLGNSPQLGWHLNNLRNYLHLTGQPSQPASFGSFQATPFSQGTGSFGLPGGFTPPERFVRVAFLKEYTERTHDVNQSLASIYYILSSVWIPRGVVVKADGDFDYTQYGGAMNLNSLTYYFAPYGNQALTSVTLTPELLAQTEPQLFTVSRQQQITALN